MFAATIPLLGLLVMAATTVTLEAFAQESVELEIGESGSADTYDPYTTRTSAAGLRICALIYEPLLRVPDPARPPELVLADSLVSVSDRVVKVRLKANMVWHDGQPITTGDVVFSYELCRDVQGRYSQVLTEDTKRRARLVESLRILTGGPPDAAGWLEFTVAKGLPGAPERYLILPILPKHVFLRDGVFEPCKNPDMAVGSGPLRLVSAKEGSNLVRFKVFEKYHGVRARLSPLMDIILDENGRMAKLQTGGVDFVAEVAPDQVTLFQNVAKDYDLMRYPSYSFESIALNFDNPIIAGNRPLRQAMMYAIDRATILDRIYGGEGSVINGPFTPATACQCAESNPYDYEIDRAMKMIGEIRGFALGADKMWTFQGKPVRFRFISYAPPGQTQREKVVQAIQNNLQDVGIALEVRILDHEATWQRTIFEEEDFDMTLISWEYDPAGMVGDLFHSRGMKQVGNYNFIDYNNLQVDRIIEAYEAATDRFQRGHCCTNLDKALNEDLPYLFLWTTKKNAVFYVRTRDYRMVRITPLTIYDTIGEWYSQPK